MHGLTFEQLQGMYGCPVVHCGAAAGAPCRDGGPRGLVRRVNDPHPDRLDRYQQAQAGWFVCEMPPIQFQARDSDPSVVFRELLNRGTVALPREPMTIEVTVDASQFEARIAEMLGLPPLIEAEPEPHDPIEDLILATQEVCRSYVWHTVSCACSYCLRQDAAYMDTARPVQARMFEREK